MNTIGRGLLLVALTAERRTVDTHPGTGVHTRTAAGVLSRSSTVDADDLGYQPQLSVTTLSGYGRSARSALTGYVTC
jgi:hypothetical protein